MIWLKFTCLYTPGGWKSDKIVASRSRGRLSRHKRADELTEMHKGVVTNNVIAGKRRRSYLVYEVNVHAKLVWR